MDKIDETILKLLEKGYISGEHLSKLLGISRVAVWKRIKKIEKEGYVIEKSKKGYKLKEPSCYLLPYEVKKDLKTIWLGQNYIFFHEINSTNIYAKENDLPHGTVVLAETQTSGKGRKGRKWISERGKGLYFSIVLKENIFLDDFMVFSLLFPSVVRFVLQKYLSKRIYIKWPNDLYIENKKFAGFLIESEIEGNEVSKVIVGIGININNPKKSLENLDKPATSLFIEEGVLFDRKKILLEILEKIEHCIENFTPEEILKNVEENLLWKEKEVYLPELGLKGILLGLNRLGGLRIKTDEGIKEVYTGDLTLRNLDIKSTDQK